MSLKKPTDFFNRKESHQIKEEINIPQVEVSEKNFEDVFNVFSNYKSYLNNFEEKLNNINSLSEQVSTLRKELEEVIRKEDLEKAILSQLLYVNESIANIENNVKVINEEKLDEIREDAGFLLQKVENFVENDIPKFKKNLLDFEIRTETRIESSVEDKISPLENVISFFKEDVENKLVDITQKTIDLQKVKEEVFESIQSIENVIGEETSKSGKEIQKIRLEARKKFEEIEDSLKQINEVVLTETTSNLTTLTETIAENKTIDEKQDKRIDYIENYLRKSALGSFTKNVFDKVVRIESEVVINENRLKKQNQQLEELEKEIYETIQDLKVNELVDDNKSLKNKVRELEELCEEIKNTKPQVIVEETAPESTKTSDPLTPLDKNYVTLDQLQEHYRVFINRVQQQLSSLGGGGETRLQYLDDIVGIATNAAAYDGKYLKYNHSSKNFEFADALVTGTGVWSNGVDGPYTLDQVGIGTDSIESSPYPGNSLVVYGNARITGIVSIGTSSITLDPNESVVRVGESIILNASTGKIEIKNESGSFDEVLPPQSISLTDISDIDGSNLSGISTDYLMVYDPLNSNFKFVDPKSYFGINNDFNPDPTIDDFGSYS